LRTEELFSRSGFYHFLLESNALLHREASAAVQAALAPVISRAANEQPLAVLDLACGGWPVTVAETMAAFPDQVFHYTGVDINPDQVESAAKSFAFPANVREIEVIEGNAWNLHPLGLAGGYALIFSGMNLHHGTPEEIFYLAQQVRLLLDSIGLFFSHDVYRPDNLLYRRRPVVNPENPSDSMALVEPERLAKLRLLQQRICEDSGPEEPAWRRDYIQRMRGLLIERGAAHAGVESTAQHMWQKDFPVSVEEFRRIFEQLGYVVRAHRFTERDGPLGPYVADCVATPLPSRNADLHETALN